MNKKKGIMTLVMAIGWCLTLYSQGITPGKIYRFNNVGKPGQSLAASAAVQGAVGSSTGQTDLRQQWYVTSDAQNSGFYLKNVATGAYLASPKQTYVQWPLVFATSPDDDTMLMSIADYEGHKVIKAKSHNNSYAFAHDDGSNNIVCWLSSSTPTQWDIELLPYSQEEIDALMNKVAGTADEIARASEYENRLNNLFSDKACTKLKFTGDLSSNADYNALPQPLKNMVDKVKTGNWQESAGNWDSEHAKKYRVQLYEPYSEGSAAASFAGIQAYTNMNNPTGVIADAGDLLYIMVDEEPANGSTLYIGGVPDCSMYNSVTAGTKLKKGLNIILCNGDNTHYFIYYTVNTVSGRQRIRKVTDFDPITIHIEGGKVNGFFNYIGDSLYTPDTEADYRYTIERARHPMYDLMGKYVILHFFKDDTPDTPQDATLQKGVKSALDPAKNPGATKHYDPAVIMKAWDDMCFAERILMGIQSDSDIADSFNKGMYQSIINDNLTGGPYSISLSEPYSDYFNNRMMGITLQASGLYMNATAWRTAYAPSTISAILSQFPQDGIWGPAHEYGHMNQTPMRIAGTTEESNNVFSNVANYFVCKTNSRCDYPSSQLKIFNEGKTYLENGTWGTTRMFWQLWCYYHATKHNTKFYPRLYELLRNYPLKRDLTTIPGKLNPKTDLLHFAKMCCIAAEEDLTNFFTSWGFFVPQDNYHIDDYDVYDCILTEEDIQSVKDEIKSFNFKPNDAIILIDDRPGSDLPTGFGYDKSLCGEYGGLKDFENGKSASGNFTFTVDGTNVSVSGNGNPGVGFLIYDEEGNLIGFSNSNNFTLSAEAASDLVAGKATVKAVGTDNVAIEVQDPVRKGDLSTKKSLLKGLIDRCDALMDIADETETKVGALFPEACVSLKDLRDRTYTFWEGAGESDSEKITDSYLELSDAYYALLNDGKARIPVVPGAAYRMVNHKYTNRALDSDGAKCISTTVNVNNPVVPFNQQWILEEADGAGNYYIKNTANGKYVSTSKKQSTQISLSDSPQSYTLVTITPGLYSFAPDNDTRFGLHIDASNNVVQWNTTSEPTQWTLVKVSTPELLAERQKLSDMIESASQLLATSGEMARKVPVNISFPEENVYTNAKYTGNNSDKFTSWSVLFDDNVATYFHSNYNANVDSDDGLDHYIRLEAPENGKFRFFDLSYITRQNTNTGTNPRSIVIEASPDKETWREVFHAGSLPTGSAISYSTGEIVAPENTRFIRFMVTGATSSAKGHPYFCLSELRVADLGEPDFTPDANFPYLTSAEMQKMYDAITDAKLDYAYSATDVPTLKQSYLTLEGEIKAMQDVMVPKVDVSSIKIGVDPIVLKMDGELVTVNASIEPEDATFPEFQWVVEDENVAQIYSVDGKTVVLKPVSRGLTNLSVKVTESPQATASATVKVLPEVPVESVNLLPSELSVPLNAAGVSLNPQIYPENASIQTLEWSSSDPTIAEVDAEDGTLTLVRPGTTVITAISTDGTDIIGRSTLTVTNAVTEGLIISPSEVTIQKGDDVTLGVTYIPAEADQPLTRWESSDPEIVAVEPSGVVRGMNVGSAVVSVFAEVNGKEISASANVTVVKPTLRSISLSALNLTLEKGEKSSIEVMITPADATPDLFWNVENPDIISLTVSNGGTEAEIEAVKPGMTLVNVTSSSDETITASSYVTVTEVPVSEIRFVGDTDILDIEDGPTVLSVEILPKDAVVPRLTWEADNSSLVSLNPLGGLDCEVTPLKSGEVNITVAHADRPEINVTRAFTLVGTSGVASLFEDKTTLVDVFEITGQIVKKQTTVKSLNNLAPGLYIIRQGKMSKEVMVR